MKRVYLIMGAFCLMAATTMYGQSDVDYLVSGDPLEFSELGNAVDDLDNPMDLDFNRDEGRENELWVLNGGEIGGTTVIFYDPGTSDQNTLFLRDGNARHFMANSSAISFSDNETFGTAQNVLDANFQGGSFTGPSLWSTDLDIYAQNHGRNGSHLDMLHGSPYCSGIEAETDNIYWVFDGGNGHICRYDFVEPHVPGGEDHSDGKVWRYMEVAVERSMDVPSHLVRDRSTDWLYIVDAGNARILRMNVNSGTPAVDLQLINEPLAEHKRVDGVEWEVYISSGLEAPTGIEVADGRLLVSDNANGQIVVYDITGESAVELGRLETNAESIMGIKVGTDNNLYYVDNGARTLVRVGPQRAGSLVAESEITGVPDGGTQVNFDFTNNSSEALDLSVRAELSDRAPEAWELSVDGVTVAANSTVTIPVTISPGDELGIGDVTLFAWVEGRPELGDYFDRSTVISAGIESIHINDNSGNWSISQILRNRNFRFLELTPGDFAGISDMFNNLKTMVWNCGPNGQIEPSEATLIKSLLNDGTNIALIGDVAMITLGEAQFPNFDPQLLGQFGLSYGGRLEGPSFGFDPNTFPRITLNGVVGDPISGELMNVVGQITRTTQTAGIPSSRLNPQNGGFGFLHHNNTATDNVAVRYETDTYRAVAMSINPVNLSNNTQRNNLVQNIIDWLNGTIGSGTPQISFNTQQVNYGVVGVGSTSRESVVVSNTGDGPLQISNISISGGQNTFRTTAGENVPILVPAGSSTEIEVDFTPTSDQEFSALMTIRSNSDNSTQNDVIELNGNGTVASVAPADKGSNDALALDINPNPIAGQALVSYAVKGSSQKQVKLSLINSLGQEVSVLQNTMLAPGEYSLTIEGSALPAGSYYALLRTDDAAVYLPVVLLK